MFETVENLLKSKIFWITTIVFVLYLYLKIVVYSYWKRHGIPHDKPTVPLGNLGYDLLTMKIAIGARMKESYDKFRKYPYHGLYIFHKPFLMINDPEIIKYVLVKEFASFTDRGLNFDNKADPLCKHLFFMTGDKWRSMRIKLAPTLTSGKLKHMYPLVHQIANEMVNVANENLAKTDILEVKDLVAKYTTETIFSLAFGFEANCLRDPDNEFRYYGDLSIKNDTLKSALVISSPAVFEYFNIPFTNPKVIAFFVKLFKDMVESRKTNKTDRKDFLSLLIQLIDHGKIQDEEKKSDANEAVGVSTKLELLEAAAQAFVFFVAGFETSSSIVTHTLYELALNPKEQEKVHQEIDKFLQRDGGFTYENVMHLEYLEMAFLETIRKHPSVPFLNRICVKDCKMPDSEFVVPKGLSVIISVSGLHRNPNIYPDPDKFDPMRFSKENVAARHPYAFLGFGEGPRICIGKRLGIMMSMIALATLLSKFKFSVCEKTPIPNRYSVDSILQSPRDGVYLRIKKRCEED